MTASTPDSVKFLITLQALKDMQAIASKSNLDTSKLDYTEVQQVLTIYSLIKHLESYGISLEIALSKEVTRVDDSWT